jgi:hypothetical protein
MEAGACASPVRTQRWSVSLELRKCPHASPSFISCKATVVPMTNWAAVPTRKEGPSSTIRLHHFLPYAHRRQCTPRVSSLPPPSQCAGHQSSSPSFGTPNSSPRLHHRAAAGIPVAQGTSTPASPPFFNPTLASRPRIRQRDVPVPSGVRILNNSSSVL